VSWRNQKKELKSDEADEVDDWARELPIAVQMTELFLGLHVPGGVKGM
jgi:hypothetical protein